MIFVATYVTGSNDWFSYWYCGANSCYRKASAATCHFLMEFTYWSVRRKNTVNFACSLAYFLICRYLNYLELFCDISKINVTLSKITTEKKKLHQMFLVRSGVFETGECCYFFAILSCTIQNQQFKVVLYDKTNRHYSS